MKERIAESRSRLYRVALAWCGNEMLADDLAQDTVATGLRKLDQLRDPEKLYPWLYSILSNTWYGHLRSVRPQEELEEQVSSEENGPMSNVREIELVTHVRKAVATLPIKERQVISLVDLEELSYCDVARALEIPIGTVMSRLHRARKHLLDRLDGVESESTGKGRRFRVVR